MYTYDYVSKKVIGYNILGFYINFNCDVFYLKIMNCYIIFKLIFGELYNINKSYNYFEVIR